MIKLLVIAIIVGLGYGFYIGAFDADDSVNSIMDKTEEIAIQTAKEMGNELEQSAEKELTKVIDESKEILSK